MPLSKISLQYEDEDGKGNFSIMTVHCSDDQQGGEEMIMSLGFMGNKFFKRAVRRTHLWSQFFKIIEMFSLHLRYLVTIAMWSQIKINWGDLRPILGWSQYTLAFFRFPQKTEKLSLLGSLTLWLGKFPRLKLQRFLTAFLVPRQISADWGVEPSQ